MVSEDWRKMLLNIDPAKTHIDPRIKNLDNAIGKVLLNGVQVEFGEFQMLVEQRVIDRAKQDLASETRASRRRVKASVHKSLTESTKYMKENFHKELPKTFMDNVHSDMILWHLLKEDVD